MQSNISDNATHNKQLGYGSDDEQVMNVTINKSPNKRCPPVHADGVELLKI